MAAKKYKVMFYRDYGSPAELEKWLNEMYEIDGLELVSADGGYFIFKAIETEQQQ